MNHEEFRDKCRKALGPRIPMEAREQWGDFIRNKGTEITLRYDWIKDKRFYQWIYEHPHVDFGEGSEKVTVWITAFGRVGHDK